MNKISPADQQCPRSFVLVFLFPQDCPGVPDSEIEYVINLISRPQKKIKCSFSSDGFFLVFLVRARPGMTTRPGQLGKAFIKIHKGRLFSSDFPSRVMRTKTFQTFPLAPQTVLWLQIKKMFLSLREPVKNYLADFFR